MNLTKIGDNSFRVNHSVCPSISKQQLFQFSENCEGTENKVSTLNFHQNAGVDLLDSILCVKKGGFLYPVKQVGFSTSLTLIDGAASVFIFNDFGKLDSHYSLSRESPSCSFYIRIPQNTWFAVYQPYLKPAFIKVTGVGAARVCSNGFNHFPFSPTDQSDWIDYFNGLCDRKLGESEEFYPEVFEQVSDVVFMSTRRIVTVNFDQLDKVCIAASSSPSMRARLCCHSNLQDKLQEMFIALRRDVEIEESVHIRKDESLTVLKGTGSYIFPNEDRTVRHDIQLSVDATFYARINRYVPHKILVTSDLMLIHEATTGPFSKDDTVYRIEGA
jgi:cupin fold WbuC family metalloprotein